MSRVSHAIGEAARAPRAGRWEASESGAREATRDRLLRVRNGRKKIFEKRNFFRFGARSAGRFRARRANRPR
jgi:hypothetical protein